MRWSIRNQLLVPLAGIQLVVVLGISGLAAWRALARVQRDADNRLQELSAAVTAATYPLNEPVLRQLRGLSGAEFILRDAAGQLVASTLAAGPLPDLPPPLDSHTGPSTASGREPSTAPTTLLRINHRDYQVSVVPAGGPSRGMTVLILSPDDLIQSARSDAIQGPILLGALTLLITTAAAIELSRRISRRIGGIERQVARVAAGDFEPIPLPPRDDELRDLSASVNRMGGELERLTGQIRESERALLVKQLAGGIAHQLRNAITGARLTIQLHQRRCPLTDDDSLDVALRQLVLTEEQVRGLAALIRDEHRPPDPGPLGKVIDEVTALVRPICEHRQLTLLVSGSPFSLVIRDRGQMRAALLNLLLNAVEASPAGGRVEMQATQSGDMARIDVLDEGAGVTPELAAEMFVPFRTTKPDGMGLGLALVRQTAEDHQGDVRYLREQGRTCFRFTCRGTLATERIEREGGLGARD